MESAVEDVIECVDGGRRLKHCVDQAANDHGLTFSQQEVYQWAKEKLEKNE